MSSWSKTMQFVHSEGTDLIFEEGFRSYQTLDISILFNPKRPVVREEEIDGIPSILEL